MEAVQYEERHDRIPETSTNSWERFLQGKDPLRGVPTETSDSDQEQLLRATKERAMTDIPIRTYSQNHPQAGYIEFSIPLMNPQEVETYIQNLPGLDPVQRYSLANEMLKQADEMWSGFCLCVGDPVQAREELRKDEEVSKWLQVSQ